MLLRLLTLVVDDEGERKLLCRVTLELEEGERVMDGRRSLEVASSMG